MTNNSNSSTEEAYQEYLEPTKIQSFRIFCSLGSLLYFAFIIADLYSLSITLTEALIIRGATVIMLFGALALSYTKIFVKNYELIVTTTFLLGPLGILVMIYLAKINDHATDVYFAGIMLVLMASLSWSYLNTVLMTFLLALIISGYIAAISLSKDVPWAEIMVSLLFFTATISISLVSQILRTRYLREIFTLKEALNKSLKEKTVESKANAFLANHDVLTGLPNRRLAIELLEGTLSQAKETDKSLLVLFIDLNGLKQINDIHDYSIGDALIKMIAKRLEMIVSDGDCLSRLGGSEFIIGMLLDKSEIAGLEKRLELYKQEIIQPIKIADKTFELSINMGASSYPENGDEVSFLMKDASEKRHEDKHKNQLLGESSDSLESILVALKA